MSLVRTLICGVDNVHAVLKERLQSDDSSAQKIVAEILEDVRKRGDAALLEGAKRLDGAALSEIAVPAESIERAHQALSEELRTALESATERVLQFHRKQRQMLDLAYPGGAWELEGSKIGQRLITLESVGVYVPGGKAFYPSSVAMNAGPARAAGVSKIVLCTPPAKDGSVHGGILFAARLVGVEQVFRAGGAYAVAAMALGTESVPKVDKIVGPGNRFVNEAKRQVWGRVGLDGYAGSSEVCVLVDETSNATFAAVDLLTQVEHAEDNCGFLVSVCAEKLEEVLAACEALLPGHPREPILRKALQDGSLAVLARSVEEAVEVVNLIAPEHLSVATKAPLELMADLKAAGCVMLGEFTPESAGDYAVGPSHTLPTAGAARFGSPVNVLDFVKVQSFSMLTREELIDLAPLVRSIGEAEGFPMHAYGAAARLGEPHPWG